MAKTSSKKVGDRRLAASARRRRQQTQADRSRRDAQAAERRLLDAVVQRKFGDTERVLNQQLQTASHGPQVAAQAWQGYQNAIAQQGQITQGLHAEQVQRAQDFTGQVAGAALTTAQGQPGQRNEALGGQIAAVLGAYGATHHADAQSAQRAAQAATAHYAAQGGQYQQAAIRDAQSTLAGLQDKQRQLQTAKGDYRQEYLGELQDKAFQQSLAMATLDLKRDSLDQDWQELLLREANDMTVANQRNNRARDRQAFDETKLQAQIQQWTEQNERKDRELQLRASGKYSPSGSKRNADGLTEAQAQKWRSQKARINSLAKAFKTAMSSGKYTSTGQVTALLRKQGYKRDELNMARDLAVFGYLSQANQEAARGYFAGGFLPRGYTANHPSMKK